MVSGAARPAMATCAAAETVAAAIRTIFAQPDARHVHEQLDTIAIALGRQFPKLEALLRDAVPDLLAFTAFSVPIGRRSGPPTRTWSGSTRRSSGALTSWVFPNPEALLRLAGAVLVEAHDEWEVSDRRYLSEGSMALLATPRTEGW